MAKHNLEDNGKRKVHKSGLVREVKDKPDFTLIIPKNQKYEKTMLYRLAAVMTEGAKKYSDRNWENASTKEDLECFKASAMRHFLQWCSDENKEDHFAMIIFNLIACEFIKEKLESKK